MQDLTLVIPAKYESESLPYFLKEISNLTCKKLIVLDPVTTELAKLADYHIKLRPGTNVAVLNMKLHFIIKNK